MAVVSATGGSRAKIRLATLAALLASLLYCVEFTGASTHSAQAASSFTVYNETQGDWHNWNLEQLGLVDNAVVYDIWNMSCTATACVNVPTQAAFDAKLQSAIAGFHANATAPLVLDFEHIVPVSASSTGQAQQDVNLYKKLIAWAHQYEPNAPIGMYSYDYSNAYSAYTKQLYSTGNLQFFAPSMYNRWASVSAWETELTAAVANDRAISSSLPIYPFVWGWWDNGTTGQLTGPDWDAEINYLESRTQGAIVWAGSTSVIGSASCGWVGDLSHEMGILTGTPNVGPLTLTLQTPGKCGVTRGATTAIPMTYTNKGTTTTAATSLQPLSLPQGITGTYSATSIPALAPGKAWNTTLSLTVPSTELYQTVLMRITYGTGSSRLTVIIP